MGVVASLVAEMTELPRMKKAEVNKTVLILGNCFILTRTKSLGNHPSGRSALEFNTTASCLTRPHHQGPGSRFITSTRVPFSRASSCEPTGWNGYNTSAKTDCSGVSWSWKSSLSVSLWTGSNRTVSNYQY